MVTSYPQPPPFLHGEPTGEHNWGTWHQWGFCAHRRCGWVTPFLLSSDLPLQCKSALTSAAGLLECVLPRERARMRQWVTRRWHFPMCLHAAHHEFLHFQRLKALRIFISTQQSTCQVGRECVPTAQAGRWVGDLNGIAGSASLSTAILPTWISFPLFQDHLCKAGFCLEDHREC